MEPSRRGGVCGIHESVKLAEGLLSKFQRQGAVPKRAPAEVKEIKPERDAEKEDEQAKMMGNFRARQLVHGIISLTQRIVIGHRISAVHYDGH